jgi:arsenite methyltransferase
MIAKERLDYGIGAPGYLITFATLSLMSAITAVILGIQGFMLLSLIVGAFCTLCVLLSGYWILGSKVGSIRARDEILSRIVLTGDEQVLDVGCGHGLLLIGAAKKLTTGRAVGVDIWRQVDQWDNHPENTVRNAQIEGVSDRVEIYTCDARQLIFPDQSFDVVVSSSAIHDMPEREKVLSEIIRVLKPEGRVFIYDIKHTGEYQRFFLEAGMEHVRNWGKLKWYLPFTTLLTASKPGKRTHFLEES